MGRQEARAKGNEAVKTTAEIVGLESFLFEFADKAKEARKKGGECFKANDYMGRLACYFEEGYYWALSEAVNGDDHEKMKDTEGQTKTIVDQLRAKVIAEPNYARIAQALKKMGKPEKLLEVEGAVNRFIDGVSADFIALSKKSTEIYHVLKNMGKMEKYEKGLGRSTKDVYTPETKLFMADKEAMDAINRLKEPETLNRLVKEIQAILA